ncbi:MAG: LysM peptidoglycan-binding domain-containing protein [Anaerolineales bacterium]
MFTRRIGQIGLRSLAVLVLAMGLGACGTTQPADITPASIWVTGQVPTMGALVSGTPTRSYSLPPTRVPGMPEASPTPDAPHYQPGTPGAAQSYVVQSGDILSAIAEKYSVSLQALAQANHIADVNSLVVGQTLTIPAMTPRPAGPSFKMIPDSELVYGPLANQTDVDAFIHAKGGYLTTYTQDVDGASLTAAQVIVEAAQESSINPRLLLALLEYRAGWVTNPNPNPALNEQPFGFYDSWYHGLYRQLEWAAIQLNGGYYRWRSKTVTQWVLKDGSAVPVDPTINAGTAGVQNFFAQLDDYPTWVKDVSPGGFFDTYYVLFGNPFDLAIEPLIPANLVQPVLQLPFGPGETWYFTGGPHLAWLDGTPYGALDFAPPGDTQCGDESDAWVTAVADGLVARVGGGQVILDLDGGNNEGSGWVIFYMHIATRDRVTVGTFLHAGDHVGHPSCEGGEATGMHVHLVRKFNGEWVSALGPLLPFDLSGWISAGTGDQYVGTLTRNGVVLNAMDSASPENQVER